MASGTKTHHRKHSNETWHSPMAQEKRLCRKIAVQFTEAQFVSIDAAAKRRGISFAAAVREELFGAEAA